MLRGFSSAGAVPEKLSLPIERKGVILFTSRKEKEGVHPMAICISCQGHIDSPVCPHCGYPVRPQNESHQLPVGTMLRNRYQVGKVLGQGGFGITYVGRDTLLETTVAIKEFYPSGMVNRRNDVSTRVECLTEKMAPHYARSKERFLREAKALVRFRSIPEVVDLLDFVEENDTAYIVMEYVRGVDLAKYIGMKGGKLSPQETFRLLRPVMEALAKVHKGGIIHRDISPDNIILDPMGGAKLLDFGAVRAVEDPDVEKGLSKSTEAILKQGFAPIEQYNTRGSLGPWTDEYAMCATVWYCLTGKVPEEASIRMSEGIDPDWSTIEGLPKHQQKALEKGFSCRARDRYKTMDELLADLFPREQAEHVPTPAEEIPVKAVKEKANAPERSGRKFWTFFATAVLALWLVIAVLIPKEIKTEAEGPAPQETAPTHVQTEPTETEGTEPPTTEPLSPEEQAYALAEALLEEGKLGEAAIAFGKLAGYADARERSFAVWDKIAVRDTVSAGGRHTVGVKKDGSVVAAGEKGNGQCDVSGWADIVAVSAGWQHTVGLRADGTVIAVGLNDIGQCDVSGWADIVAISAGSWHTVGLRADGTVIAVGPNDNGQCDVSGWTDIVAISAGGEHTVGLMTDGTVVAVGQNTGGQCDISGWSDIVAIDAGGWHTVGLKADGTAVAVGYNSDSRCDVTNWTDIVTITAGSWHTVGLKSDGTTVAVGTGTWANGQCDVEEWSGILSVSAGEDHTVGLKSDGTLLAVGDVDDLIPDLGILDTWTDIMLPKERVPFR